MTHILKLEVEVPNQNLYDVLTTAVEGGIRYWLNDLDFKHVNVKRDKNLNVLLVSFVGDEDGKTYLITPEAIISAAQVILSNKVRVRKDIVAQITSISSQDDYDIDAQAADVLFQVAAFGDIIYG